MSSYGPGQHPNSLAALKPFAVGPDPRRFTAAHRPAMGATVREWFNELDRTDENGDPVYDVEALEKIASDPKAPHSKAIAARDILQARDEGWDNIRRVPSGANSRERIMDRTEGKPTVRVEVQHSRRPLEEVEADLARVLADDPELLEIPSVQLALIREARSSPSLREQLRPVVEQHYPDLLPALEPVTVPAVAATDQEIDDAAATEMVVRSIRRARPRS